MTLLWLMVAGALGAASRYGLNVLIQGWMAHRGSRSFLAVTLGPTFPLATLIINVSGSFLLSFLTTLVIQDVVKSEYRTIWGTGFLGAYTTFSTFELESEGLISQGRWMQGSVYVLGNLVLGFLAVILGRALALRLIGPELAGGGR